MKSNIVGGRGKQNWQKESCNTSHGNNRTRASKNYRIFKNNWIGRFSRLCNRGGAKMKNKNVVLYVLIALLLMVSLFQAVQINELNNDMENVVEIQDIQQEVNESISVILDENIKSIITITDILVKIVN